MQPEPTYDQITRRLEVLLSRMTLNPINDLMCQEVRSLLSTAKAIGATAPAPSPEGIECKSAAEPVETVADLKGKRGRPAGTTKKAEPDLFSGSLVKVEATPVIPQATALATASAKATEPKAPTHDDIRAAARELSPRTGPDVVRTILGGPIADIKPEHIAGVLAKLKAELAVGQVAKTDTSFG